jgi:hypothetical protein
MIQLQRNRYATRIWSMFDTIIINSIHGSMQCGNNQHLIFSCWKLWATERKKHCIVASSMCYYVIYIVTESYRLIHWMPFKCRASSTRKMARGIVDIHWSRLGIKHVAPSLSNSIFPRPTERISLIGNSVKSSTRWQHRDMQTTALTHWLAVLASHA